MWIGALVVHLMIVTSSPGVEILAQMGTFDRSPNEFALAPSAAAQFHERFPNGVTFEVGKDDPSRFPFIHPSSLDTKWCGEPVQPFRILFRLPALFSGQCVLFISLFDQHEQHPSTLHVELNGEAIYEARMPLGSGRAFLGPCPGAPKSIVVPFDARHLWKGGNKLVLTLRDGSWIAYDALALVHIATPGDTVKHVPVGPGETEPQPNDIEARGALTIPVHGGWRCVGINGETVALKIRFDKLPVQLSFDLVLEEGDVTVACAIPRDDARGDYWRIIGRTEQPWEMVPTPINRIKNLDIAKGAGGSTYHVEITQGREDARLSVTGAQGKPLLTSDVVHVAGPDSQLRFSFTNTQIGAFTITNLRWRKVAQPSAPPTPPSIVMPQEGAITLECATLALSVDVGHGVMNPCRLHDKRTGIDYADRPYLYRLGQDDAQPVLDRHELRDRDGAKELVLFGHKGSLAIEHRFHATEEGLEETVRVTNTGDKPLDTSGIAFGFAKSFRGLADGGKGSDSSLVPIPYRRDTSDPAGVYGDIPLQEVAWRNGYYWATQNEKVHTSIFGSEGWSWVQPDATFLWIKYNPDAMEFSLVEPFRRGNEYLFRFGGCGLWKRGDPEPAARLMPGESFQFGTTRYSTCDGGWKGAYYALRDFMEKRGHRVPNGYNPPVHWNELYDNPLWWGPDTPKRRDQFYRREDMETEARKTAELGCDALYLDPGWDTSFASSIWAENRLGPQEDFVRMLRDRYGLKLAFHCPLAGWCDVKAYPVAARRKDESGKRLDALCSASPAYLDEKAKRLIALCDKGAAFLMFDGSAYTGTCYDADHRHSLPLTRHEHVMAYLDLTRRVHEKHPDVLIELHDPVVAGVWVRYAPTYFLHALPGSFDELWGYEYMWDPMADLIQGRSISLYYVNLAYSIPIYLHIDLRKDNDHALMFWWYASTCRHLGVGGKHPDPAVWEAHKAAMRTYLEHKRFYTQGTFWGLDETVHAHTLADEGRCVLNVFNLGDVPVEREIRFSLADIGLGGGDPNSFTISGASSAVDGYAIAVWVDVPARGHRLILVEPRR